MQKVAGIILATVVSVVMTSPAMAESETPLGIWQRDTGSARVRIASCGDKLCGDIVWVRDTTSRTKVGMRIFYDGERDRGNVWIGKAFNPEDQQIYTGSVLIAGDTMTATGCVIGRLLCSSYYWKRLK